MPVPTIRRRSSLPASIVVRSIWFPPALQRKPAVDDDSLTGNHRRAGTQEKDRFGNVLRLAGAFERRALDRGALPVLWPVLLPRAVNMTRRHRIDPDLRRQGPRQAARQID